MSYWVERNFSTDEDGTILPLTDRAAPLRDGLRADPTLAALHDRAVAWRKARFEALMLEEPYRALFGRLLLTPPSRPLAAGAARFITGYAMRAARADTQGETAQGDPSE
jgi:hypothetical protein